MTFRQELASWSSPSPPSIPIASPAAVGSTAPSSDKLRVPNADGRPVVVTFLRHCGCPFAEETFLNLREQAAKNPDIAFVAVSHSNEAHTSRWLSEIGGPGTPANPIHLIVDPDREIYAAWGLGISSFMHVLSPAGLAAVFRLAREKGIKNRPTESGSRWQTSGNWAMDAEGVVRWGGVAARADEVPTFEEAVRAVKVKGGTVAGGAKL